MFIDGISLGIGFGIGLFICITVIALLLWGLFLWFISGDERKPI